VELRPLCPAGSVALGGGGLVQIAREMLLVSGPYFANGTSASAAAAGMNPAPSGWSVTATNTNGASTALFKAVAICAQLANVVTMVRAPVALTGNGPGDEAIVCPAGYVMVGGGTDAPAAARRSVFAMLSSPVYNGYGYAIDRVSGTYPAAAGWFAIADNFSNAAINLTVAAVCAQVAVVQPGSVVAVYEFYNTNLKHYFRTSSAVEAAAIDKGSAGAGWVRTGDNFAAYAAATNTPGSDVCRFYTFGANSHFYTAFAEECAALKSPTSGWTYEGLSFRLGLPANQTSTACPAGTFFVYRLYNDRFAQTDSNHRFTSIFDDIATLQAQGWKYEGLAFCSLNYSAGEVVL
jgi:hypothetical protein